MEPMYLAEGTWLPETYITEAEKVVESWEEIDEIYYSDDLRASLVGRLARMMFNREN